MVGLLVHGRHGTRQNTSCGEILKRREPPLSTETVLPRTTHRYRHNNAFAARSQDKQVALRQASVDKGLPMVVPPRTMLEPIRIEFIKAHVPSSTLSSVRYAMRITNRELNCSWEMVRPFREFAELKDALLASLKHGHLCESKCPFLYMHITQSFPRRHLLLPRMPRVIASQLVELEAFMNTMLRVCKTTTGECKVMTKAMPKTLHDFLHPGMAPLEMQPLRCSMQDSSMLLDDKKALESLSDSLENPQVQCCRKYSASGCSGELCPLCEMDLKALNAVTTLACGHRFHDECILVKLNESLHCPVCQQRQHI